MTTQNDFLVYAGGSGANVLSQGDWAAYAQRDGGLTAGILPSVALNKALRQGALMAAAMGVFMNAQGQNAIDGGDSGLAALATAIHDAIVTATGGGVLSGEIKLWGATTTPTGYLECDGSAVSRTTYAALFAVIGTTFGAGDGLTTFNIPDMRGQFARGWDHGAGRDTGRTLGTNQTDAMQGHYHGTLTPSASFVVTTSPSGGSTLPNTGGATSNTDASTGAAVADGTHGTPRIAAETRPTNVALMFIIKT